MTVRYVSCICGRIDNFTEMVMCPVCAQVLCKSCAVAAPQKGGVCGKRITCHGQPAHPAAEGTAPPPPPPAQPPRGILPRLFKKR